MAVPEAPYSVSHGRAAREEVMGNGSGPGLAGRAPRSSSACTAAIRCAAAAAATQPRLVHDICPRNPAKPAGHRHTASPKPAAVTKVGDPSNRRSRSPFRQASNRQRRRRPAARHLFVEYAEPEPSSRATSVAVSKYGRPRHRPVADSVGNGTARATHLFALQSPERRHHGSRFSASVTF